MKETAPRQESTGDRTVRDFGRQWTEFTENKGYYGSVALLEDILGPLLPIERITGCRVGDIGSGTGRIVQMLLAAGADHVVAVEPSDAHSVLVQNLRSAGNRVTTVQSGGEKIADFPGLDLITSVGVLHHIPDPDPVVKAAHSALRPGGVMVAWLYGQEGNEAYLRVVTPLRRITTGLPHWALSGLCSCLNLALDAYLLLARWVPLPLRSYAVHVLGRLDRAQRHLVIYDQLNPRFAKYYRRVEVVALFERAGFTKVRVYHRHGYSWTVTGEKTGSAAA